MGRPVVSTCAQRGPEDDEKAYWQSVHRQGCDAMVQPDLLT